MQNIGEEICGEYLKNIIKCDFVTYNVMHPEIQGEIDVVGVSLESETIYLCEAATHTGGLQYVTDRRPDNYNRFYSKFEKSIDYATKYFSMYSNIKPMIWSPIVKISGEKAKYNTYNELLRLQDTIKKDFNLDLELMINESYQEAIWQLKDFAFNTSSAFSSSVMRLFQVESKLQKHVALLKKKAS